MNQYHLVATAHGWKLVQEDHGEPIAEFSSRWEAIDKCGMFLEGERCCSLAIHRKDGSVESVRTFSSFAEASENSMEDAGANDPGAP
jgi:hypothetical protein